MFPLTQETYQRLLAAGPYQVPGYPFFNLLSPGAPPPGPSFILQAERLGDQAQAQPATGRRRASAEPAAIGPHLAQLYFQALYDPDFAMPVVSGNKLVPSQFVPGHSYDGTYGPRPMPVMIVGKWPGRDELVRKQNFVGATSEHFWNVCDELGIPVEHRQDWYITNLIKFGCPDANASKMPTSWMTDSLPLLWQELQIVRPRYILCLGADASKVLTKYCPGVRAGREGLGVEAMRGRVEQFMLRIPDEELTSQNYQMAQLMTVVHPAQVHRTPDLRDSLQEGVSNFWSLTCGKHIGGKEYDIDHRVIRDEAMLAALVDEILASENPRDRILAIDAEWNGEKPWDPGAYVRTVQFSHRPKFAACVEIHGPGGVPVFSPSTEAAARQLKRLFLDPRMRIGGHFLRSDIPWLHIHLGIDLRAKYAPASSPELVCEEGGWETGLAEHALCETGMLGLEVLRTKYTTAPAYEALLDRWKKQYCAQHKIEAKDLEGFGDWDSPDFYTYANYDADVTRRSIERLFELLHHDRFNHDCRKSYWLTHRASLAVLEMEQVGMLPDPQRAEELATVFNDVRGQLVDHIRHLVNWPSFNPNSHDQCRGVLFGDSFARKSAPAGCPSVRVQLREDGTCEAAADAIKRAMRTVADGLAQPPMPGQPCWVYLVPSGVVTQNLTPITTTGKKPISWEKVVARGEEADHVPTTGKETLGILSYSNRAAAVMRDIRYLSKALQTTLRRPETDAISGEYLRDDDDEFLYEKGLMASISSDGRIHTRMSQTKETGRSGSSKPALQNLTKQREDDFQRILGYMNAEGEFVCPWDYGDLLKAPRYTFGQRSVFRASPGHVFIESDYASAELAGIMWMAQDPQGMDDVRRNMLPSSHPDYLDIHSNMAVMAFGLNCAPTKKGLKSIGKPGLRIAAKNVVFGIPYGRGAEAIARQCREKGENTTIEDAQRLVDYYLTRYPGVAAYLERCRERVRNPMWIRGAFGRYRRFHWTDDQQVAGEQERQACNYSIQNLVADAVWTALANMWDYRAGTGLDFRFILQIHDAILLEVPFASVPRVYRDLFPKCMVDGVDIWPCDLDGRRHPIEKPYHMAGEREVMFRWGEDVDGLIKRALSQEVELGELLCEPANDARVVELLQAVESYA